MTPTTRITSRLGTDPVTSWGLKILSWLGAALGGALLVLLLNASGTQKQLELNSARLDRIEASQQQMQAAYATNKRVDDLQAEVRANFRDLSGKMDTMLGLLVDAQKKRP